MVISRSAAATWPMVVVVAATASQTDATTVGIRISAAICRTASKEQSTVTSLLVRSWARSAGSGARTISADRIPVRTLVYDAAQRARARVLSSVACPACVSLCSCFPLPRLTALLPVYCLCYARVARRSPTFLTLYRLSKRQDVQHETWPVSEPVRDNHISRCWWYRLQQTVP